MGGAISKGGQLALQLGARAGLGRLASKAIVNMHNLISFKRGVGFSSASKKTASLLFDSWSPATFPNRMQSIRYHHRVHGSGYSLEQYTQRALDFFKHNIDKGKEVILKNGQPGYSIKLKEISTGGYWTLDGKIVTFWMD